MLIFAALPPSGPFSCVKCQGLHMGNFREIFLLSNLRVNRRSFLPRFPCLDLLLSVNPLFVDLRWSIVILQSTEPSRPSPYLRYCVADNRLLQHYFRFQDDDFHFATFPDVVLVHYSNYPHLQKSSLAILAYHAFLLILGLTAGAIWDHSETQLLLFQHLT